MFCIDTVPAENHLLILMYCISKNQIKTIVIKINTYFIGYIYSKMLTKLLKMSNVFQAQDASLLKMLRKFCSLFKNWFFFLKMRIEFQQIWVKNSHFEKKSSMFGERMKIYHIFAVLPLMWVVCRIKADMDGIIDEQQVMEKVIWKVKVVILLRRSILTGTVSEAACRGINPRIYYVGNNNKNGYHWKYILPLHHQYQNVISWFGSTFF